MGKHSFQVASDIIRDGLGVELLDSGGDVVAEIFRCDKDHSLVVSTFGNDIPMQVMEKLLEKARTNLEPFEDGTPLSDAKLPKST